MGYAGSQEQLANQQQQLQLAARQQGLDAGQAYEQLGFGLSQAGTQYDPTSYLAASANAQGSAAQQYAALGSQASLTGGLGPNFLTGVG